MGGGEYYNYIEGEKGYCYLHTEGYVVFLITFGAKNPVDFLSLVNSLL